MKKEINTSLSARIKRRNAVGFKGEGNHQRFDDKSLMGNYRDINQNGKAKDLYLSERKKQIADYVAPETKQDDKGVIYTIKGFNRPMRKRYANNKQAW